MSNLEFFEQIQNPTWKQLSMEIKQIVFQNVLRYFVNPLLTVEAVKPVRYIYAGVKTETFEVEIDHRTFVFVPGQKSCILGWDNGLKGLSGLDCSEERQELRLAIKQFMNQQLTGYIFQKEVTQWGDFSEEVLTTQKVADRINQQTSPLRAVDIPPMLVEKRPFYVGMRSLGQYSVVTGNMLGDSEVSADLLEEIRSLVLPEIGNSLLFQEFPKNIRTDRLFLQQNRENGDVFDCYMDDPTSLQEVKSELDRQGMELLNEDEWEYCCGATVRRLFKWGNQLKRTLLEDETYSPLWNQNMFGIEIANAGWGPELIDSPQRIKGGWLEERHKAPIVNLLPFSTYYRPDFQGLEEENILEPGYYCARRIIRIEL